MPSEKLHVGLSSLWECSPEGPGSRHVGAMVGHVGPRLIEYAIDTNHKGGTDETRGESQDGPRSPIVAGPWRDFAGR